MAPTMHPLERQSRSCLVAQRLLLRDWVERVWGGFEEQWLRTSRFVQVAAQIVSRVLVGSFKSPSGASIPWGPLLSRASALRRLAGRI